ncbi:hypothetical protein D3C78_289330 [compost metagenome]
MANACAKAPADAGRVEQGQGQVGRELEVLVVGYQQVVVDGEGHHVPRAQFAVARWVAAVDLGKLDIDGGGLDGAGGGGTVGLSASDVDRITQHGGIHCGVVADAVAFVELVVGRVVGGVGGVDQGVVDDAQARGALLHSVVVEVAEQRRNAGTGYRLANGFGNVEDQRGAAVGIHCLGVDQGNALCAAMLLDDQGRRVAWVEGLAIAEQVGQGELALFEDVLTEGKEVGNRHAQGVAQGIAGREASGADVVLQVDLLEQGYRLGDERRALAVACFVECVAFRVSGAVARVQRVPVTRNAGGAEVDRHRVTGGRVDHGPAVGVDFRYIETDLRGAGGAEGVVVDVIAGHESIGVRQCQSDECRVGQHGAVMQGDRRQGAARPWSDGADVYLVGHGLGDGDIAQRLPGGGGDGDGLGTGEVGPGDRFALRHVQRLRDFQQGGRDDETVQRALNQAWVLHRVVQRIVAVFEARTGIDGEVWRAVGIAGVGQVTQLRGNLDVDAGLAVGDAGVRQLQHHHLVTGLHAHAGCVDYQCVAAGIFGKRMGGIAVGIERDHEAVDRLAQVGGGDESGTVIAVAAGSRQEYVDEWGVAFLGRGVVEAYGEGELFAQLHLGPTAIQAGCRAGIGQQALEAVEGGSCQSDDFVDIAIADLKAPVAAGQRIAGRIARCANVGTRPACQFVDQRLASAAGTHITPIQLNIRTGVQLAAPSTQPVAQLLDRLAGEHLVAEGELA